MYVLRNAQDKIFYAATDPLRFAHEAVKYHRDSDVKIDFVKPVDRK